MNIVLLSGGSGKRLWPLSNDVRSKQFLRLFKDEKGKDESMVQRVFRQITTVDPNASIIVATSKTQVGTLKNQLGENISVCVEPCRRDTFPAIILAATYLKDKLGVEDSACVAVCPVDPYVDTSYYAAIQRMESLVLKGNASLTLMGIQPTYPSDKYGYIIPASAQDVSAVKAFKEKPDVVTAEEYIRQGALWNAGVFVFQLKYLLDKAHKMVDFTDYTDLYMKYDTLPKISFDYAVVEKESNIQVMRYMGEWHDIGTWNTLTDVMTDMTKGNALLDDMCERTYVVNELGIPVLCVGCKDMVIALSSDGLLVADKERSGSIKSLVESFRDDARYVEKSWGTYSVIDVQPKSLTAKLTITMGCGFTYHSHAQRSEIWVILSGRGRALIDGEERIVEAGDSIIIPIGCRHTLMALTDMQVIEAQLGVQISKADKMVYVDTNEMET